MNALIANFGLIGDLKQVDDNASRIDANGLQNRVFEYSTPQTAWQFAPVNIGDIGSQDQRGFLFTRDALQNLGLPDGQLNGVGRGFDEYSNRVFEVFDAL